MELNDKISMTSIEILKKIDVVSKESSEMSLKDLIEIMKNHMRTSNVTYEFIVSLNQWKLSFLTFFGIKCIFFGYTLENILINAIYSFKINDFYDE